MLKEKQNRFDHEKRYHAGQHHHHNQHSQYNLKECKDSQEEIVLDNPSVHLKNRHLLYKSKNSSEHTHFEKEKQYVARCGKPHHQHPEDKKNFSEREDRDIQKREHTLHGSFFPKETRSWKGARSSQDGTCPHCQRQCALNSPRCGHGAAFAASTRS